jgi:hypothetical protein
MKLSNLALRIEADEPDTPALQPAAPALEELAPAERRLVQNRRLGLEYRAIVIRDDGLRPFRVR